MSNTPAQGHSWMLPAAKGGALIYATGGCSGTCVLSYPKGELLGSLAYGGGGNCSASNGNVFIVMQDSVVEFAHGGTSPIATYPLPSSPGVGCAVDRKTGNLAVVNNVSVTVFGANSSEAISYSTLINPQYCGYDSRGNLFVDGFDGQDSALSELSFGASSFEKLQLDQSVGQPGQVQWDGHHLTYESQAKGMPTVSRLSISGSVVTVLGQTVLKKVSALSLSWIYKGSVIAPYAASGGSRKNIGIWRYPRGGIPTKRIKTFGSFDKDAFNFTAVTLSVSGSR